MQYTTATRVCDHCGREFAEEDCVKFYDVGFEQWCEHCVESYAVVCGRCGELCDEYHIETVHVITHRNCNEERFWCDSCADEYAERCEDCGELYDRDCIGIYEVSHSCGTYDECLCDTCRNGRYEECIECGCLVNRDMCEWDEWGEYAYCESCYSSRHDHIAEYHHTYGHSFLAYGDNDSAIARKLYIGVEYETICPSGNRCDLAESVEDWCGDFADCKEDSSLGSNGLEIALQPATPKYLFRIALPQLFRLSNAACARANGTCGFHNHIDRRFFSCDESICRLDRMLQNHPEEWRRFAGRGVYDMNEWCRIESNNYLGIQEDCQLCDVYEIWRRNKAERPARYRALNLTNRATVEIRLWGPARTEMDAVGFVTATTGLALAAETLSLEFIESSDWESLALAIAECLESNGYDPEPFLARFDKSAARAA